MRIPQYIKPESITWLTMNLKASLFISNVKALRETQESSPRMQSSRKKTFSLWLITGYTFPLNIIGQDTGSVQMI